MDGKTSMLPAVANESFVILRESVMTYFNYKPVHAALVNFFAGWHSTKVRTALKNFELNALTKSQDLPETYDTSLWQVHSVNSIRESIVKMASISTIEKALGELQASDVIVGYRNDKETGEKTPIYGVYGIIRVEKYQHPRLKFDKRNRYLYLPKKLSEYLNHYSEDKTDLETLVCQHNVASLDELVEKQKKLLGEKGSQTKRAAPDKTYPQAACDAAQVSDFTDTVNLGDRLPKFNESHPKSTESFPKFNASHPKSRETIASIQQDTTRIAEAEMPASAVDDIGLGSVEQKSCSLAEQHFARMTAAQKNAVANRVQQLGSVAETFTLPSWVGAIGLEMQKPDSFTQSKSPSHKLNCILQQAKAGRWSPLNVAAEIEQKQNAENAKARKALEDSLRKLLMDRQMWQRVIKNPSPHENHPAYLDSARTKVAELNQQIIVVQSELAPVKESSH